MDGTVSNMSADQLHPHVRYESVLGSVTFYYFG